MATTATQGVPKTPHICMAELGSHEWLTKDHAVQRTRFSNGVTVTVNFGDHVYQSPEGFELEAMGSYLTGMTEDAR